MSYWLIATVIYVSLALITFIPTLVKVIAGVKLHPGGVSFDESPHFSEEAKLLLTQHFTRIQGTLGFWKKQAEIYRGLHYYTLIWTIPTSVGIPFLVQAIDASDPMSKWLVTIISFHAAVLLAFHKALKIDDNFKSWREGESHFYDLYRRMLDRPEVFGTTENERLTKYFDDVENVRMFVRNAEVKNIPSIEESKKQLATEPNKTKA